MTNIESQRILQCYHCGNKTLMNMVGEHKEYWDEGFPFRGVEHHKMFVCPVCQEVSLLCAVWQEKKEIEVAGSHGEQLLYPSNSFDAKGLPDEVKAAYEAALKTKEIDKAVCFIALRRTLEIVCNEKNAAGRDLWHKLEDLSQRSVLPPALKHASNITKTYGNMGAHAQVTHITQSELDYVIEFVRYILDYLYILPAKWDAIQKKMSQDTPSATV